VLADAGFVNVHVELAINGLVLYAAERVNEVRPTGNE